MWSVPQSPRSRSRPAWSGPGGKHCKRGQEATEVARHPATPEAFSSCQRANRRRSVRASSGRRGWLVSGHVGVLGHTVRRDRRGNLVAKRASAVIPSISLSLALHQSRIDRLARRRSQCTFRCQLDRRGSQEDREPCSVLLPSADPRSCARNLNLRCPQDRYERHLADLPAPRQQSSRSTAEDGPSRRCTSHQGRRRGVRRSGGRQFRLVVQRPSQLFS